MSLIEFFDNHTYRMVFFGTMTIGLVAGALGSFAYLRKQSLISDVSSHAALPGTLLAFLTAVVVLGVDGRNMIGLIIGAVVVGTIAVLFANGVTRTSKIHIDTAMAVALTIFFGAGMLLMRIIANGVFPGKGGIQDYLFGNASVITIADLTTSIIVGSLALVLMLVFWKEFALLTFDPDHSTVLGFRARTIDMLMFTTIVIATVIGVKAVGLVLMVAFVVTPPAAARQWTRTLPGMVALSAVFGALGSGVGAYLSIVLGKVPTGPLIVLTLFAIFLFSLLFSPRRSIITRIVTRARARSALKRELVLEGAAR
ncbi:metal ABC transporter permease [Helcobacillus massiliensis]|uniref:metal ABC transporter permease n=1 Tax=Helcobacillus massiliensis TaxID=521392 RepID=UPI0025538B0E|nr:metal ABC transporter permease [Helcobacillus massiliensis]MDK7741319.1 metal ABC transporter permease [Helcobacillus massiliensis]WOO92830.1 metal ABC transporter permease [Helcobacillus massiliensis]